MNRVMETIRFCRRAEMSGGPFGVELILKALNIRSPWADEHIEFLGGDWRWSLTRIIYGYHLIRGVLYCQRGITLKAPNELVFDAYTHPRTGMHYFATVSFRYRYFFWQRYSRQINVHHDFDLFPSHVQEWLLDLATRHFRGESFGYIVIQGTEEAWEILTHGKYKRGNADSDVVRG